MEKAVGHAVERVKPRDLLREALPAMHPRLFRLLDRAGPQAKPHASASRPRSRRRAGLSRLAVGRFAAEPDEDWRKNLRGLLLGYIWPSY